MSDYSRTFSEPFTRGLNAQFTDEYGVMLVEATHDDLAVPLRLVNAREAVTFDGVKFDAFPFSLSLPSQGDDSVDDVTLTLKNFTWDAQEDLDATNPVELLRPLQGPVTVRGWFTEALRDDAVLVGPFELLMRVATADVRTVALTLSGDDVTNRSACVFMLTPITAPGAFE